MKNGLIVDAWGNKRHFLNDKLHCEDGPAVEWNDGCKCWFINGNLHRLDGSAFEGINGHKCWYIDGKRLTEEEEFEAHPKRIAYLEGLKK